MGFEPEPFSTRFISGGVKEPGAESKFREIHNFSTRANQIRVSTGHLWSSDQIAPGLMTLTHTSGPGTCGNPDPNKLIYCTSPTFYSLHACRIKLNDRWKTSTIVTVVWDTASCPVRYRGLFKYAHTQTHILQPTESVLVYFLQHCQRRRLIQR